MFRILPYLIIVLVMTVFSKGLDFFKLFDQEVMPSKAAQEDDKPTKKKPELVTPNESLNTETSNEPKAKEDDVVLPKQDVNLRNSDYVHSSNDSGNLDLTKICNPSLIFSRAEIDLLQSLTSAVWKAALSSTAFMATKGRLSRCQGLIHALPSEFSAWSDDMFCNTSCELGLHRTALII